MGKWLKHVCLVGKSTKRGQGRIVVFSARYPSLCSPPQSEGTTQNHAENLKTKPGSNPAPLLSSNPSLHRVSRVTLEKATRSTSAKTGWIPRNVGSTSPSKVTQSLSAFGRLAFPLPSPHPRHNALNEPKASDQNVARIRNHTLLVFIHFASAVRFVRYLLTPWAVRQVGQSDCLKGFPHDRSQTGVASPQSSLRCRQ